MKNFDLQARAYTPTELELSVPSSPAGELSGIDASVPFLDVADLARLDRPALREEAIAFTRAVMPDPIRELWRESVGRAGDAGLRLRVRTADPASAALPWELLYDEARGHFLALNPATPVVRYPEGPIPAPPPARESPLRVLLTAAAPLDQPPLAVAAELDAIERHLKTLADDRRPTQVQRIDHLAGAAFDEALLAFRPHVWHFAGHGEWDEDAAMGMLLLEDEQGRSARVDAEQLADWLRSRGVALAVLNACEGAEGGGELWSGLAQGLVRAGVPAVAAMQAPISDEAAGAFGATLFLSLAAGHPLDVAVVHARQAMARLPAHKADAGEWLLPALFMRAADGRLWREAEEDAKARSGEGRISIGEINAVNVGETQIIDQRGATFHTGGETRIDTGGGAYVGGDVDTGGGDFTGRDRK
jgi:hypothetical protein